MNIYIFNIHTQAHTHACMHTRSLTHKIWAISQQNLDEALSKDTMYHNPSVISAEEYSSFIIHVYKLINKEETFNTAN